MTLIEKLIPLLATRFDKSTDDIARGIEEVVKEWFLKEVVPKKKEFLLGQTTANDQKAGFNSCIDLITSKVEEMK